MIDARELDVLKNALATLAGGFDALPSQAPEHDTAAIADVLQAVAARMQDNFPYHHPRYAGQMLKPPHPVARLAYALSLWLNPNNHALDGGRASSAMEKECVAELARMFGMAESLGHLCGGGTMANLEALWVAGRLAPGRTVAASAQAHYTQARISEVQREALRHHQLDGPADPWTGRARWSNAIPQLDAEVRKPADAQRYAIEQEAEAHQIAAEMTIRSKLVPIMR